MAETPGLFVVEETEGRRLSELEDLNLQGKLHIDHLERVRNLTDARRADMRGKKDLRVLIFSWDKFCEFNNDLQVLEALEPHHNLKKLEINRYKGASLPFWMGNPVYNKLVSIKLTGLENCLQLSLLGKLRSLKKLELYGMKCMKYIDDEVHGEGATIFPSLQDLDIVCSENLERLSVNEGGEMFPRLTSIRIRRCPKLILPRLPSVKILDAISRNNSFLVSVSNLSNLTHLYIASMDLDELAISVSNRIENRIPLPGEMFINLTAIRSLKIECFTYIQVPSNSMIDLTALEDLEISRCSELVDFAALGPLPRLQRLLLRFCKKLRSLPVDIQDNTTLSSLKIFGCLELKRRYLHEISHISYIYVDDC